ncbi:MAG: YihY/virulence factor BrkB family protein [Candidatus Gastranaerophilales bacterium]|nr:YihY/virulence factor BrkB family protein [Candidatus Gastranaerophilales bacterium]MCM1073041.1 YihY/virulence factor BrkB family protein [Bacteroides sp.]
MNFKNKFKTLKSIIQSVVENDFFGMASEMGFMLCIGIFPFILFLTAIFGFIGKNYFMGPIFIFMHNIMPTDVINLINTVLNEVFFFKRSGLIAVLGFCITLFLSTNTIAIVAKGLNRAYKVKETRNFFYSRLLALIMVFVNTLVLFLSITLIVFGKVIIKFFVAYLGMTEHLANIMLFVRWPIAFLTLFIMAYLSYYILPDLSGHEKLRRHSALPGTIFFCISWLLGSWLFSVYINNLHTYNFVYGTIAGFAVMMMWLYYTSILILIGGEINSQLYEKLERKEALIAKREGKI